MDELKRRLRGLFTVAQIRMKGRNVFMGYLNEPEMTADAFDEGGWYKTTDIGHRDEHGFLYLTGSAAGMIIYGWMNLISGYNLNGWMVGEILVGKLMDESIAGLVNR